MRNIPTGFNIRPLDGSIVDNQLLARYLPMERFFQFLKQKSLWFTRIYRWKDGDVCEASLLPTYYQYLKRGKTEAEFLHIKTLMEFQLRANLGCCFSLFDDSENDLMWRSYTPKPEFGVMVILQAGALEEAISRIGTSKKYLSKITYLNDEEASSMRIEDCPHSRTINGNSDWDATECTFFKRIEFNSEKEVRAILSLQDSWPILFHEFINREHIAQVHFSTPTPIDQPYLRIDMRNNMVNFTPKDRTVFLTLDQMRSFSHMVENEAEAYFQRNTSPANSNGMYVPFDLTRIEKVILHPGLRTANEQKWHECQTHIQNADLQCPVVDSNLYQNSWHY